MWGITVVCGLCDGEELGGGDVGWGDVEVVAALALEGGRFGALVGESSSLLLRRSTVRAQHQASLLAVKKASPSFHCISSSILCFRLAFLSLLIFRSFPCLAVSSCAKDLEPSLVSLLKSKPSPDMKLAFPRSLRLLLSLGDSGDCASASASTSCSSPDEGSELAYVRSCHPSTRSSSIRYSESGASLLLSPSSQLSCVSLV